MKTTYSRNKVPIRLTEERWLHISLGHPEMANFYFEILETIESPMEIYEGSSGEFLAVSRKIEGLEKYIVVVYKETTTTDGFIITAFLSNKLGYLKKRNLLWKQ